MQVNGIRGKESMGLTMERTSGLSLFLLKFLERQRSLSDSEGSQSGLLRKTSPQWFTQFWSGIGVATVCVTLTGTTLAKVALVVAEYEIAKACKQNVQAVWSGLLWTVSLTMSSLTPGSSRKVRSIELMDEGELGE
jgi:hypothetical protein